MYVWGRSPEKRDIMVTRVPIQPSGAYPPGEGIDEKSLTLGTMLCEYLGGPKKEA
jgi:hypothetical protein